MPDYLTFQQIYQKVARLTGDLSEAWLDKAKDAINMVYMDEVLPCDDLYILFFLVHMDDSIKAKAQAVITGVSKAATAVVTAPAHGYENGDVISIADITSGMTELNDRIFVVANKAAGTLELNDLDGVAVASTNYTTYTSGGVIRHRGVTPSTSIECVLSAAWHGFSKDMEPISQKGLEESSMWWDAGSTSIPSRYLVHKYYDAAGAEVDRILWFPLPADTYRLRYWYEKRVSPLSADGDVPILPVRYQNLLVTGPATILNQYGGVQTENAVVWPQRYVQQLAALKSANRRWWRQFEKDERSSLYLA